MGIKFKQIDNLQNTFDSLYESLSNRIKIIQMIYLEF